MIAVGQLLAGTQLSHVNSLRRNSSCHVLQQQVHHLKDDVCQSQLLLVKTHPIVVQHPHFIPISGFLQAYPTVFVAPQSLPSGMSDMSQ